MTRTTAQPIGWGIQHGCLRQRRDQQVWKDNNNRVFGDDIERLADAGFRMEPPYREKVEDTAKRLSQERCPEMVSPIGSLEFNVFNWLSGTGFVSEKGNLSYAGNWVTTD